MGMRRGNVDLLLRGDRMPPFKRMLFANDRKRDSVRFRTLKLGKGPNNKKEGALSPEGEVSKNISS